MDGCGVAGVFMEAVVVDVGVVEAGELAAVTPGRDPAWGAAVGCWGVVDACGAAAFIFLSRPSPSPLLLGEGLSNWHSCTSVSSTRNCLLLDTR